MCALRMLLARAVCWLAKPALEAEIDRRAETTAQQHAAVALVLASEKIALLADIVGTQNALLNFVRACSEQRDEALGTLIDQVCDRVIGAIDAARERLPGETKAAREDAAADVAPSPHAANKLH